PAVGDDTVRLKVIGRLGWIQRQRGRFAAQPRQSARQMVGGETRYYLGRRYRPRVVERDGPTRVELRGKAALTLDTRAGAGAGQTAVTRSIAAAGRPLYRRSCDPTPWRIRRRRSPR